MFGSRNSAYTVNLYRLLHAFECNMDIISRVNGEVISRGVAECNLAISE